MPLSVNLSNFSKFSSSNNLTHLEIPMTGEEKSLPGAVVQQLKGTQKWDERFECWLVNVFTKITNSRDNQDSRGIELRMLEILHLLEFEDAASSSQTLSYERLQMTLRTLVKNLGQVNSAIILSRCYQLAHLSSQFASSQAQSIKALFNQLISAFEQKYQHLVKKEHVQKELDLTTLSPALSDAKAKTTQKEKIKKTALVLLGLVGASGMLAFHYSYGARSPVGNNQGSLESNQHSQGSKASSNTANSQELEGYITFYPNRNPSGADSLAGNDFKVEESKHVQSDKTVSPISTVDETLSSTIDGTPLIREDTSVSEEVPNGKKSKTVNRILDTFNTIFNLDSSKVSSDREKAKDESFSAQPSDEESSPAAPVPITNEPADSSTVRSNEETDSAPQPQPLDWQGPVVPPTESPVSPGDGSEGEESSVETSSSSTKKAVSAEDQTEILELKRRSVIDIHKDGRCKELFQKHIESIIPENPIEEASGIIERLMLLKHKASTYLHDLPIEEYFNLPLQDIGMHIEDKLLLELIPGDFLEKLWPYLPPKTLSLVKPERIQLISPEKIVLNPNLFNVPSFVQALTNEQLKASYQHNADIPDAHFTPEQCAYLAQLRSVSLS